METCSVLKFYEQSNAHTLRRPWPPCNESAGLYALDSLLSEAVELHIAVKQDGARRGLAFRTQGGTMLQRLLPRRPSKEENEHRIF